MIKVFLFVYVPAAAVAFATGGLPVRYAGRMMHKATVEKTETSTVEKTETIVDARHLTDLKELEDEMVCHFHEIEQRDGKYSIDVPPEHLRDLGLFLEREHPSLMCEGRFVNGAGRLTWMRRQGYKKSKIQRKIANSLEEVLVGGGVGTDNITPFPVGGGPFAGGSKAPDVSGFVREPTELQSCFPLKEGAPWPQVWIEIAHTDTGRDYLDALEKIEDCVRGRVVAEPCVYILIALQQNPSRPYKDRMFRDAMDLGVPSLKATSAMEPTNAPKLAVWLPGMVTPSWYALRTNTHVDIPIPTTDPPKIWRFELNLVCQCYDL